MREEVGIDENGVWGFERSVVLEEERRGNLGNLANYSLGSLFLLVGIAIFWTLKSRIALADDTFNSAKLPSLFRNTHDCIVGGGMLVELAANCQVVGGESED